MADWAGIASGLGQVVEGGTSGLIEAKKEKRITDRQDELWNEQQNAKLSDTVTSANNIRQYVDPTIDPWAQAHAAATAAQTHAAQFTGGGAAPATPPPAAPTSKPSVVPPLAQSLGLAPAPAAPSASPLAPGYLQQQLAARQPANAAAPAQPVNAGQPPQVPQAPPQWTGDTDDPVANQNHARYEAFRQKVERDAASIHDAANGDSKKEDQMLAAYYRNHKSEFDDQQKALDTYLSNANQNYQRQRMDAGMDAWFSDEGLGNQFGPGAHKDGNTLVLPDGKTKMLLETPLVWAAFKKGIASQEDVMKSWGRDTKNATELMSKNKDTAVAIQKMKDDTAIALAQLRAARDPKASMADRVYALHRKLGESDAEATRAEASFIEHGDKTELDKLREQDMEETRAEKRVDSILKPYADPLGGYDEKKMTPSRMLTAYNSLIGKDPTAAVALYRRMPETSQAAIDAQASHDVGANPNKRPAGASSPSPKVPAPAPARGGGLKPIDPTTLNRARAVWGKANPDQKEKIRQRIKDAGMDPSSLGS